MLSPPLLIQLSFFFIIAFGAENWDIIHPPAPKYDCALSNRNFLYNQNLDICAGYNDKSCCSESEATFMNSNNFTEKYCWLCDPDQSTYSKYPTTSNFSAAIIPNTPGYFFNVFNSSVSRFKVELCGPWYSSFFPYNNTRQYFDCYLGNKTVTFDDNTASLLHLNLIVLFGVSLMKKDSSLHLLLLVAFISLLNPVHAQIGVRVAPFSSSFNNPGDGLAPMTIWFNKDSPSDHDYKNYHSEQYIVREQGQNLKLYPVFNVTLADSNTTSYSSSPYSFYEILMYREKYPMHIISSKRLSIQGEEYFEIKAVSAADSGWYKMELRDFDYFQLPIPPPGYTKHASPWFYLDVVPPRYELRVKKSDNPLWEISNNNEIIILSTTVVKPQLEFGVWDLTTSQFVTPNNTLDLDINFISVDGSEKCQIIPKIASGGSYLEKLILDGPSGPASFAVVDVNFGYSAKFQIKIVPSPGTTILNAIITYCVLLVLGFGFAWYILRLSKDQSKAYSKSSSKVTATQSELATPLLSGGQHGSETHLEGEMPLVTLDPDVVLTTDATGQDISPQISVDATGEALASEKVSNSIVLSLPKPPTVPKFSSKDSPHEILKKNVFGSYAPWFVILLDRSLYLMTFVSVCSITLLIVYTSADDIIGYSDFSGTTVANLPSQSSWTVLFSFVILFMLIGIGVAFFRRLKIITESDSEWWGFEWKKFFENCSREHLEIFLSNHPELVKPTDENQIQFVLPPENLLFELVKLQPGMENATDARHLKSPKEALQLNIFKNRRKYRYLNHLATIFPSYNESAKNQEQILAELEKTHSSLRCSEFIAIRFISPSDGQAISKFPLDNSQVFPYRLMSLREKFKKQSGPTTLYQLAWNGLIIALLVTCSVFLSYGIVIDFIGRFSKYLFPFSTVQLPQQQLGGFQWVVDIFGRNSDAFSVLNPIFIVLLNFVINKAVSGFSPLRKSALLDGDKRLSEHFFFSFILQVLNTVLIPFFTMTTVAFAFETPNSYDGRSRPSDSTSSKPDKLYIAPNRLLFSIMGPFYLLILLNSALSLLLVQTLHIQERVKRIIFLHIPQLTKKLWRDQNLGFSDMILLDNEVVQDYSLLRDDFNWVEWNCLVLVHLFLVLLIAPFVPLIGIVGFVYFVALRNLFPHILTTQYQPIPRSFSSLTAVIKILSVLFIIFLYSFYLVFMIISNFSLTAIIIHAIAAPLVFCCVIIPLFKALFNVFRYA